jgi:hypothetical protein
MIQEAEEGHDGVAGLYLLHHRAAQLAFTTTAATKEVKINLDRRGKYRNIMKVLLSTVVHVC